MGISNIGASTATSVAGTAPVAMGALAGGYSSLGKYDIPGGLKAGTYILASYQTAGSLSLICSDGTSVSSVQPSSLGNGTALSTQTAATVYAAWKKTSVSYPLYYMTRVNDVLYASYGRETYNSTNGTTWNSGPIMAYNPNGEYQPRTVAYGNGYYLFPTYRSDNSYGALFRTTSLDYQTATTINNPGYYAMQGISFGAGVFVITTSNSNTIWTTTDGATLTQGYADGWAGGFDTVNMHNGLPAGSGSLFILGGSNMYYGDGRYKYSSNGTTWTTGNIGGASTLRSLAYGNGTWVAIMANNYVYYSTNGTSWTFCDVSSSEKVTFTSGSNKFAMISNGVLRMSSDGITWTNYGPTGASSTQVASNSSSFCIFDSSGGYYVRTATPLGAPGASCTFSLFTDAYNTLN